LTGALCSVIPDFDVVGFHLGIRYGNFWGHSRIYALARLRCGGGFRSSDLGIWSRFLRIEPPALWTYFCPCDRQRLLDALTDGGLGVAFFSPFDNLRCFLLWTLIRVSPIAVGRFFSARGLAVVESELIWIWLPAALLVAVACLVRCCRSSTRLDVIG
jgi:inner membrane protein